MMIVSTLKVLLYYCYACGYLVTAALLFYRSDNIVMTAP